MIPTVFILASGVCFCTRHRRVGAMFLVCGMVTLLAVLP